MSPIEIIVIIGVVLVLVITIIGGIIGRAKAKKNGVSCGGCAGCRHATNCAKKGVATDDNEVSSIVAETDKNSSIDVDDEEDTDKSDI